MFARSWVQYRVQQGIIFQDMLDINSHAPSHARKMAGLLILKFIVYEKTKEIAMSCVKGELLNFISKLSNPFGIKTKTICSFVEAGCQA